MRISSKRVREYLLIAEEEVDPDIIAEQIALFLPDGTPLDLAQLMSNNYGRYVASKTTGVLAAAVDTGKVGTRLSGGGESGVWPLAKGTLLTAIAVSRPCRVRLYTTAAKRDADVPRDRFTDPMDRGGLNAHPDHGCLSEFLLLTQLNMNSIPADYLQAESPTEDIYYRIDNYDLAAGAVTVSLTLKDLEL